MIDKRVFWGILGTMVLAAGIGVMIRMRPGRPPQAQAPQKVERLEDTYKDLTCTEFRSLSADLQDNRLSMSEVRKPGTRFWTTGAGWSWEVLDIPSGRKIRAAK